MLEILPFLKLLVGFFLLIKGADWLVEYSVLTAKRLNISPLYIGIFVLSIGTSIPELFVSLIASYNGEVGGLIMGNIIGSNIANVLLVLGIMALFLKVPIDKKQLKVFYVLNLIIILVIIIFSNDFFINKSFSLNLSRIEGGFLIGLFIGFITFIFFKKDRSLVEEDLIKYPDSFNLYKTIFFFFLAISMVTLGGNGVVEGALYLSREVFHISEGFVGLTIIAIGTSLPEIVTSLLAAKKNQANLALGNILGSNIFNILWVLSLASIINPLSFKVFFNIDMLISFGSLIILGFILFLSKKRIIDFKTGVFFLILYLLYLGYLFFRG